MCRYAEKNTHWSSFFQFHINSYALCCLTCFLQKCLQGTLKKHAEGNRQEDVTFGGYTQLLLRQTCLTVGTSLKPNFRPTMLNHSNHTRVMPLQSEVLFCYGPRRKSLTVSRYGVKTRSITLHSDFILDRAFSSDHSLLARAPIASILKDCSIL